MGNTLQQQLLKAGLANKKQAVRAKKAKNNKEKLRRSGVEVVDEAEQSAKAAEQARVEKDKQLNREKNAAAQKKAIQAQIRQLITMNRLSERGDQAFKFEHAGLIKSVYVTAQQLSKLASGALAVASLDTVPSDDPDAPDGDYELIARAVALKIIERDPARILCLHDKSADENPDDDDDEYSEYSEYQIPDDLMW